MSNQWHRGGGGGGGRGGGGRGGGGRGGRNNNQQGSNQPRRDLLRDDFGIEFPLWKLTSYGPGASKNNLLGGDTSPEEVRWVSGATRARVGDHGRVFETMREYERLKENDRTVLKAMPETQLKQVFDSVDAGSMKPAGAERKIEFQMVPQTSGGKMYERVLPVSGGGGTFGGGAVTPFGGGFQQQQQQTPPPPPFGGVQGQQGGLGQPSGFGNVPPVATPSASPFTGGGFQNATPSTPAFGRGMGQTGAFTSNAPAAKPVVTVTSSAPQNQAATNQFTPEFNPADPFGSRDFALGQIPDQPPPPQYCT